jgi:hypothetical protein
MGGLRRHWRMTQSGRLSCEAARFEGHDRQRRLLPLSFCSSGGTAAPAMPRSRTFLGQHGWGQLLSAEGVIFQGHDCLESARSQSRYGMELFVRHASMA